MSFIMALVQAKCPECGGLIEVDNEKRLGICRHCGGGFSVVFVKWCIKCRKRKDY